MNSKRVEEIKRGLGGWDTAELLEIWNTNDRKSYSDEAFEAIRSILIERGVAIPQQSVYVPMEEHNKSRTKRVGKILFWIGLAGLLLSVVLIFAGCSQMTNMDDPEHMGPVILGFLLAIVFFPIAVIGASAFFVGMWGEKKLEKHQCETSTKRRANFSAMAIASLVLGIFGIPCFFFFYYWYYSLFGLLGTVFGVIALINLKRNPSLGGRKTAITGLMLGIVLLILGLLSWFHVWRFYW